MGIYLAVTMGFWMGLFMAAIFALIVSVQNELLGRLFLFSLPENDDLPSRDIALASRAMETKA